MLKPGKRRRNHSKILPQTELIKKRKKMKNDSDASNNLEPSKTKKRK